MVRSIRVGDLPDNERIVYNHTALNAVPHRCAVVGVFNHIVLYKGVLYFSGASVTIEIDSTSALIAENIAPDRYIRRAGAGIIAYIHSMAMPWALSTPPAVITSARVRAVFLYGVANNKDIVGRDYQDTLIPVMVNPVVTYRVMRFENLYSIPTVSDLEAFHYYPFCPEFYP